ncbi:MAG: hypothetical protein ACTSXD_11810 [Candidatus Heimdallarchaeaceae archaeon]
MRTIEEWNKQMMEAHDCKKCHGKIFAVRMDKLGNSYCAYCGQKVNYPKPTKEEIKEWMKNVENK